MILTPCPYGPINGVQVGNRVEDMADAVPVNSNPMRRGSCLGPAITPCLSPELWMHILRMCPVASLSDVSAAGDKFVQLLIAGPVAHTLTWIVRPMFCMVLDILT